MEAKTPYPWAKLIPLSSATSAILLSDQTSTIGSLEGCSVRLAGDAISGTHCSISKLDDVTSLLTSHVDGQVVLNDAILAADEQCSLYNGDRLILSKTAIGAADPPHSYIFTLLFDRLKRRTSAAPSENKPLTKMMSREQAQAAGEQLLQVRETGGGEEPADPSLPQASESLRKKDDGLASELSCGICFELIHNCVSVIPCLHNFCGACISGWMKNDSCPLCKATMTKLKKNTMINSLIESIVKLDVSKRRSQKDLEEMDSRDRFRLDQEVVLRQERRTSRFVDDEDLSDDGSGRERPCPECSAARPADGFHCGPDTLHLSCTSCRKMFPNRSATFAQKCELCMNPYCSLYLGGCDGDLLLLRLRDHRPEGRLNEGIFRSNLFELGVGSRHPGPARVPLQQESLHARHLRTRHGQLRAEDRLHLQEGPDALPEHLP